MTGSPPAVLRIAVTCGEPAGIGPDVVIALATRDWPVELVALGSEELLRERAREIGLAVSIEPWESRSGPSPSRAGHLRCLDIPLAAAAAPGKLDTRNAPHVLAMLDTAGRGALSGHFDAVVTAPVHKGVINDAGIPFTGHTEHFAAQAGADVLMVLVAGELRVALATTHLPLAEVPRAITPDLLMRTLRLLDHGLRERFAIALPRIAVLGLNPHAGEGGHLGREEIDVIAPTLARLAAEGLLLEGPLSADTAFVPERRTSVDAYLAMFHDQGLPVLKALGFGGAVNVTLGLPYIRTSVDHGTALELAGTGRADPSSLRAALDLAITLCARRGPCR